MSALILVASVIGLAFGVIYTLFKPRWAILFIIILYPLEQLLTTASSFFANNSKVLNILVGLLAVFGASAAFLTGKSPLRGYFNPVFLLTLLLYGFAAVGVGFAPEQQPGIEALIGGLPYLGLLLIFSGLLLNDLDDFRRLIIPLMIVGSAIVVLILLSPQTTMYGGRLAIEGTKAGGPEILNPLATASLGGTIVIFGMLYKPQHAVVLVNLIRGGAITVGLTIALMSGSRGQLLGAIFCGVVMFPFARRIRNMAQFFAVAGTAGVGIVFVMLVLSVAMGDDSATRWSSGAMSEGVDSRTRLVSFMLGEYISNPGAIVQGLGTASFSYYWTLDDTPYVHNMPVHILTENGLIGFGLMCVILLLTFRAALSLLRMYRDQPRELSTAAILIAFCLYWLILSLKQGAWFTSGSPFWTFLLLAKIEARARADMQAWGAWAYPEEPGAVAYGDDPGGPPEGHGVETA